MKFGWLVVILIPAIGASAAPVDRAVREAVEAAAKISRRPLSPVSRCAARTALSRAAATYGDDALKLTRHGGLEALEQGARHGAEFWKLARHADARAMRSLALHADELLPLVRRVGPEFLALESKVPGLAARTVAAFGDDAARALSRAPADDISRLLGLSRKADSAETRKLLGDLYLRSGHRTEFLRAFDWKRIMAGGLSAAAVTAAYKISDGVETGLKIVAEEHPEQFARIVTDFLTPLQFLLAGMLILLLGPPVVRALLRRRRSRSGEKERADGSGPPES
ncbi:MAG: hypothetical protein MR051_02735 [Lentisphaeria bacterium]|nr:hypothetical protein [Lentisphaeria bacterium]